MFSRNDKKGNGQGPSATPTKPSVPSILSADLKVHGDLNSAGEIQIDGEVSGDIRSEVVLIGESAKITGEIFALTIRVHGSINGQIKAKNVHLAKTAHVVGDILHENLSIDEGAYIEGHITRMEESAPTEDRVNLVVNKGQAPARPAQTTAGPSGKESGSASAAAAISAADSNANEAKKVVTRS